MSWDEKWFHRTKGIPTGNGILPMPLNWKGWLAYVGIGTSAWLLFPGVGAEGLRLALKCSGLAGLAIAALAIFLVKG